MKAEFEVLVRPSHPEWDERLDDYREVVEALRDHGIDAQLADMAAPPSGSDLPDFVPLAFAVYVAHKVADAILAAIIEEVRRVLVARAEVRWMKKGEGVRGVIYGPGGEVLHEFTFQAPGDDDSPLLQREEPDRPGLGCQRPEDREAAGVNVPKR